MEGIAKLDDKIVNKLKLLLFLPLWLCCFCKNKQPIDLLCGAKATCWELNEHYGMYICRDGSVCEYEYSEKGRKVALDYGDVIVGQLHWKLQKHELIILAGDAAMQSFTVKSINESQLVVASTDDGSESKELIFLKARNQLRPSESQHTKCGCK